MAKNAAEVSGPLFVESDPVLYPQVAVGEVTYNALADRYRSHIDALMGVVTAEALKDVAPADKAEGVRDALVWRMDGDIADGSLDFAARLAARVHPIGKGEEVPPSSDGTIGIVYKPHKRWNGYARALGEHGLLYWGLKAAARS